ncbi:Thioesterase superfamily protein [compost metagenome]
MTGLTQREAATGIPEGFVAVQSSVGFTRHNGGVFVHRELPIVAARIAPEHLNSLRIVHGGYLATLADSAFGVIFKRQFDLEVPPVTVSLSVDYLGAVREGEWLEAHVEILKFGRSFASASCLLKVGERLVLRASGTFTVWKGAIPRPD